MIDFGICLAYFLRAWVMVSSPLFVWFHFDVERRNRLEAKYPLGSQLSWSFISAGALFGLFMALDSEISRLFAFLPHHWGTVDEGGDFMSLNKIIGGMLGLGFTTFIYIVFKQLGLTRESNQHPHGALNAKNERTRERRRYPFLQGLNTISSCLHA